MEEKLKISMAAEYAVRCVLFLSKNYGRVVPRREVAKAMDIPEQFLVKIAHDLSRAGIITILQGRKGGYRLNRDPGSVTVLDVLEVFTGRIALNLCVKNPEFCKNSRNCPLREVWVEATDILRKKLGEVTFQNILSRDPSFSQEKGKL